MKFGTLKRLLAVLIAVAIVVAAGTVVGQAPELFGADVADDPEASIQMSDQTGDGERVTVDNVSLSEGGFVVVADSEGQVLAVSDYLEAGSHENVTVERRDEGAELLGQVRVTVHRDTDDDETFDYEETDGEEDGPFVENGYPVSDTATVTSDDDEGQDEGTNGSFRVESVDAPDSAPVGGALNVTAEIRNPNDFETRQHVEFRLDGMVYERRVLTLGPDETREIEFAIDLTGVDPGSHTYGIYTTEDGSLGDIVLEAEANASVSIVEVRNDSVVVDATLPTGGFLALENETGTVLATSGDLEEGDHDNVSLEFGNASPTDENLTVVAYRGEAADPANATAYTVDDERVAASVSNASDLDDSSADGGDTNDEGDDNSSDGESVDGESTDGDDGADENGGSEGDGDGDTAEHVVRVVP